MIDYFATFMIIERSLSYLYIENYSTLNNNGNIAIIEIGVEEKQKFEASFYFLYER